MAWNDIDWLSASRGGGFMENQRTDEKEKMARNELATQQNQYQQSSAERKREFDTSIAERTREFDARLPLIQYQIKTQQDAQYDQQMFPILMQKLANQETTVPEAAATLKTTVARTNLATMAAQLDWKKAQNNAQVSILKDEAMVFNEFPEATADLNRFKPFSSERSTAMIPWLEKAREKTSAREMETYRQKQEILGEERRMIEDVRGGWREGLLEDKMAGADGQPKQPVQYPQFDPVSGKRIGTWLSPTKGPDHFEKWKSEDEMTAQEKNTLKSLHSQRDLVAKKITEERISAVPNKKTLANMTNELAVVDGEIDKLHHKTEADPAARTKDYSGYGPPMQDGAKRIWRLKPGGNPRNPSDYDEVK